jgi:hypothetical protein
VLKTQWYQGRRRLHRQRGAALVEAGLIFPILMFFIFAIIEVGMLLSAHSAAANAVRAGGRMASVQGNVAQADQMTLARLAEESTAIRNGQIEYVTIWHAAGPESTIPNACRPTSVPANPNTSSQGVRITTAAGSCNIYYRPQASGGAFQLATVGAGGNPPDYYFGCTGPSGPGAGHKLDCNWAPIDRETVISPRELPTGVTERLTPDYVGVYIRVQYRYVTGLLGSNRTITDNSITLLEPSNFGVD